MAKRAAKTCYQRKFAISMKETKGSKKPMKQRKAIAHSVAERHCGVRVQRRRKT